MPPDPEGTIVVGGFVNGLGIVRALGGLGIRVSVITTQPFDIAQHSRWVDERHHIDNLQDRPDSLAELLEYRARQWSGRAVFPTNDEALASLAQHAEKLSRCYRLVIPPPDAVPYLLAKDRMMRVADAVGVPLPRSFGPATHATASSGAISYPVVVKPDVGHTFAPRFHSKLLVANTRDELLECVRSFADAGVTGHVFDLIPGADNQIFCYCVYVDREGNPSPGVTVRKLRQSPASFGVARVAELGDEDARLREPTVEILRHMGFRGIGVAEYKLDPRDGTFRFMEVNGRSVIYNRLIRRGGLDLARVAWSDYVLGQTEPVERTRWGGVWIHLHADVLRSTLDRRREQVGFSDYLAPYRRPKIFAVWSARDPRPFLAQWSRTAREAASAVVHGRGRQVVQDPSQPG